MLSPGFDPSPLLKLEVTEVGCIMAVPSTKGQGSGLGLKEDSEGNQFYWPCRDSNLNQSRLDVAIDAFGHSATLIKINSSC